MDFFHVFIILLIVKATRENIIAEHKVYVRLDEDKYCIRRLNKTHQIGCTSKKGGNVGVLYIVQKNGSEADMDYILKTGKETPYTVGLYIDQFTVENLRKMDSSGRVSGVILLHEVNTRRAFSPDTLCPNENFGLYTNDLTYKQCSKGAQNWNYNEQNRVSGIMFMSWVFPIFLVQNPKSVQRIENCFQERNKRSRGMAMQWPLCGVELKSRPIGAKNAEVCLWRQMPGVSDGMSGETILHCSPLQSINILNSLYSFGQPDGKPSEKSIIVLATRLDSMSFFSSSSYGVSSTLISVITMLCVADALKSQAGDTKPTTDNVLFVFFDGESWGYIGSSHLAEELSKGNVTVYNTGRSDELLQLNTSNIKYYIELDQISPLGGANLWLHTDPTSYNNHITVANETDFLINAIKGAKGEGMNLLIKRTNKGHPLPPASFQSLLAKDSQIPGVVISDYDTKFVNKYYHSFLDDFTTMENESMTDPVDYISNVTTLLTRTVLGLLRKTGDQQVLANKIRIQDVYQCFFGAKGEGEERLVFKCPFLKNNASGLKPFDTYVSITGFTIESWDNNRPYISLVTRLLLNLTGTIESTSEKECQEMPKKDPTHTYFWDPILNICTKSNYLLTRAISPGFELSGGAHQAKYANYSLWVESYDDGPSVRLFLIPGLHHQLIVFLSGLLVFTLSALLTFLFYILSNRLLTMSTVQMHQ